MTKIMLVEDDNNLREIYEARLLAEGYEIVSAKDGEEALAIAVKEKPDLIISDVMMPKISGFDMLDILRSTAETKNTKVIMMTALSQQEDKERADKLGADRYLVKSQVTLEDVAKVASEVIDGQPAGGSPQAVPVATAPAPVAAPAPSPVPMPVPAPAPTPDPAPIAAAPTTDSPALAPPPTQQTSSVSIPVVQVTEAPVTPAPSAEPITTDTVVAPTVAPAPSANVDDQIASFMAQAPAAAAAPTPAPVDTSMPTVNQDSGGGTKRVVAPLHDISTGAPDLNALLAKEEANDAMAAAGASVINPQMPPTPPAPSI